MLTTDIPTRRDVQSTKLSATTPSVTVQMGQPIPSSREFFRQMEKRGFLVISKATTLFGSADPQSNPDSGNVRLVFPNMEDLGFTKKTWWRKIVYFRPTLLGLKVCTRTMLKEALLQCPEKLPCNAILLLPVYVGPGCGYVETLRVEKSPGIGGRLTKFRFDDSLGRWKTGHRFVYRM